MTSKFSVNVPCGHLKFDPQSRHKRKLDNKSGFYSPALSDTSEPSMESIEEEMARVCGEGERSPLPFKSSHMHHPKTTLQSVSHETRKHSSGGIKPISPEAQNIEQCKVTDWRLLRLKNESDFQKKMKLLSEQQGGAQKRARLEKRFLELFGEDEITISSPTGNMPEKKDKDAIAALTVKHLMPMYKKQKIASKDLFKKLAKHISGTLTEKLNSPDERDLQSIVQEYFQNGKCVLSEADIYQ